MYRQYMGPKLWLFVNKRRGGGGGGNINDLSGGDANFLLVFALRRAINILAGPIKLALAL